MQARAAEDLRRLVVEKLAAAQLAHGKRRGLRHAAPPDARRRRTCRRRSRMSPRSAGARASARRSRRCRASSRSAGHRLARRVRGARHRQGHLLFRDDPPRRPADGRACCPSCCAPPSSSCPGRNRCGSRRRRSAGSGRCTSVICLLDGRILPLDLGAVPVGNVDARPSLPRAGDADRRQFRRLCREAARRLCRARSGGAAVARSPPTSR